MKQSNVVADYMMIEHDKISQDFNPATMEGYKYIFHGEEEVASLLPTAPEYRVGFKEETRTRFSVLMFQRRVFRKCTTIDSVCGDGSRVKAFSPRKMWKQRRMLRSPSHCLN